MPYRTDDLTPLLTAGDQGGGLQYAQGKLLAFNPVTLENEVAFRGTVVRNLNVSAAAVDAAVWQPGDLLELRGYAPKRGPSVWWIGSRILTPGPGAAAQLTAALSAINAANITSSTALGTEVLGLSSSGFEELPGGPTLSMEIGATGKVIVHLSASITGQAQDDFPASARNGGRMGVALSGANTVDASADKSVAITHTIVSWKTSPVEGNTTLMSMGGRFGTTFALDGLNPGLTTFTAMYDRLFVDFEVGFTDRTIVVVRS